MRFKNLLILTAMLTAVFFSVFSEIDNFQKYMENRPEECSIVPTYLYSSEADIENDNTKFSRINYKSESLSTSSLSDLVDKILLEHGDIICIQDILSDEDAYSLYKSLNANYAHFLYIPPEISKLKEGSCLTGLLVASKYLIKQYQFNIFQEKSADVNEGFVDFIIENKNIALGHIYAANLSKNNSEEMRILKIKRIKEKIQNDISNVRNGFLPFVLFGALNNPLPSLELKNMLEEFFCPNEDGINCILVVKYVTIYSDSEQFSLEDNNPSNIMSSNPRVTIQSLSNHSRFSVNLLDRLESKDRKEITSCSNEGKPGVDVGLRAGCTWGDKGVEYSGSAYGRCYDGDGNYLQIEVEQKSSGEGSAEVSVEYKSQ